MQPANLRLRAEETLGSPPLFQADPAVLTPLAGFRRTERTGPSPQHLEEQRRRHRPAAAPEMISSVPPSHESMSPPH
jgi:hypothetical protein